METINRLNEQLHDCQRKYTDLLTTTSLESFHQTELKQELIHITNDKEKFETKCQELEVEYFSLSKKKLDFSLTFYPIFIHQTTQSVC